MKRSPLARKTPLARAPMKRSPHSPKQRARTRSGGPSEATKAAVMRRDGGCVAKRHWGHDCWGGLHLHHVLPRSRGGGHDATNLVVLCARAHQYVHEHPAWSKERGLLE